MLTSSEQKKRGLVKYWFENHCSLVPTFSPCTVSDVGHTMCFLCVDSKHCKPTVLIRALECKCFPGSLQSEHLYACSKNGSRSWLNAELKAPGVWLVFFFCSVLFANTLWFFSARFQHMESGKKFTANDATNATTQQKRCLCDLKPMEPVLGQDAAKQFGKQHFFNFIPLTRAVLGFFNQHKSIIVWVAFSTCVSGHSDIKKHRKTKTLRISKPGKQHLSWPRTSILPHIISHIALPRTPNLKKSGISIMSYYFL